MKNIITILILAVGLVATNNLHAQDKITTATIEVKGVCGMCKERIENAAYIKGVKKVDWDKNTQKITVTYRNDKVTENDIHKSITKAGHDTGKIKANEEAYKKLPACCSYNDGVEVH